MPAKAQPVQVGLRAWLAFPGLATSMFARPCQGLFASCCCHWEGSVARDNLSASLGDVSLESKKSTAPAACAKNHREFAVK